jgi:hypothetical protein
MFGEDKNQEQGEKREGKCGGNRKVFTFPLILIFVMEGERKIHLGEYTRTLNVLSTFSAIKGNNYEY